MEDTDIPEKAPSWTLFFEGTLYRRYLQYMKNHDLSKMLNNGNTITNKNGPIQDPPVLNNETCWYENHHNKGFEGEAGLPDYNDPPMYPVKNGSPPPYKLSTSSNKYLTEPERRHRNRQTCGCVFLGIVLLGLAATAAALIIHFVFIEDRQHVSHGGNVHIPPHNGSDSNRTLDMINQSNNITIVEGDKIITGVKSVKDVEKVLKDLERDKLKAKQSMGKDDKTSVKKDPQLVLLDSDGNKTDVIDQDSKSELSTESPQLTTAKSDSDKPPATTETTKSTTTKTTTPVDFWTTTPGSTTIKPPEVSIEFNDTSYGIGKSGELRCKINGVRMYDLVYLKGNKIPIGQDTIMKFEVLHDGESCLKGNDSRISVEFKKEKHPNFPKYEDIELVIRISNVQCNDEDSFECGIEGPDARSTQSFLQVSRKPDTSIRITNPPQVIENENIFLTARWMSGYPEDNSMLEWQKSTPGKGDPVPLDVSPVASSEPRMSDCKTEMTSVVTLLPTMEMNGTRFHIKAVTEDGEEISSETYDLLVVPGDLCEGKAADSRLSHPYTCQKYVKCSQGRVLVMPCPTKNTCFDANDGQCVPSKS
ncbi:hypothetical protein FSP39_009905 [Pinctada imbricata]|uniref:Chitin-binding type-2 domain-containing protein n=1 Tax=Pinctada imbricata TaxID=66713 RepID=A0AA89BTC7_PINIB|nr:hypothetical protein FSP39_009905 [Pinctada imbricata]